jgi:polypeptide N-acetylgalactosaminyltransferase
VDVINDDTFAYENVSAARVGGFDWSLLFTWQYSLSQEQQALVSLARPVPTPTMPGGLFAIHREFFLSLGGYDPGKMGVGGTWAPFA